MSGTPAIATGTDLLEAIVTSTRRSLDVRRGERSERSLAREAMSAPSKGRMFEESVARTGRINVIAECKRRSPSGGVLCSDYDPEAIARAYERAGAAAISVLTEPSFFDGALNHLRCVCRTVDIPVLRKDFIVDPYQIAEARAAGAAAVLLIVAVLDDELLGDLIRAAVHYDLAVLVEVHDEGDAARAVAAGARLIGVNNRNLRTMAVDPDTSRRVIRGIPSTVVAVAESGLRTPSDIRVLRQAGYRAFLVGEHMMRSSDPGRALAALLAGAEGES